MSTATRKPRPSPASREPACPSGNCKPRTKPAGISSIIRPGSRDNPFNLYIDSASSAEPTYVETMPDLVKGDFVVFPGDEGRKGVWKIGHRYVLTDSEAREAKIAAGSVELGIEQPAATEGLNVIKDEIAIQPRPVRNGTGVRGQASAEERGGWKALASFRDVQVTVGHCDTCDVDIHSERMVLSQVQPSTDLGIVGGEDTITLWGCPSCFTVYALIANHRHRRVVPCAPGSPEQREHADAMDKAANVRQNAPPATSGREASTTSAPSTRNSAPLPTRYGPRGNPVDDRPTDPDRFDTAA